MQLATPAVVEKLQPIWSEPQHPDPAAGGQYVPECVCGVRRSIAFLFRPAPAIARFRRDQRKPAQPRSDGSSSRHHGDMTQGCVNRPSWRCVACPAPDRPRQRRWRSDRGSGSRHRRGHRPARRSAFAWHRWSCGSGAQGAPPSSARPPDRAAVAMSNRAGRLGRSRYGAVPLRVAPRQFASDCCMARRGRFRRCCMAMTCFRNPSCESPCLRA